MRLSGFGKRVFRVMAGAGLMAGIGCGGAGSSGNTSGSSATGGNTGGSEGAAQRLYFVSMVPYPFTSTIKSVPVSANGSVAAATSFDAKGIKVSMYQVAIDKAGNFYATVIDQLKTSSTPATYKIVEFSSSASGSPMPIRTIPGSVTGLGNSNPLFDDSGGPVAVDFAGNIAVTSDSQIFSQTTGVFSIRVFSPTDNTGPAQLISKPVTPGIHMAGVSFDSAGNIYAMRSTDWPSPSLQLLEFAAGASGDAAPIRTLDLSNYGVLVLPQFDGSGNMYFYDSLGNGDGAVIQVFAPDASGTAAPIRTIKLPSGSTYTSTGYHFLPLPIQVSAAGDIYVVADYDNSGQAVRTVLHYPPGTTGVAMPLSKITSPQFEDGSYISDMTLH